MNNYEIFIRGDFLILNYFVRIIKLNHFQFWLIINYTKSKNIATFLRKDLSNGT